MAKFFKTTGKPDYVFLGLVLLICLFGLLMLTSAGSPTGFQRFGDSYFFIKRQLISFVIGFVLLVVMMNVDYRYLKKIAVPLLVAAIGTLLLVFIPGIGTSLLGGARWISIGGLVFQPSELAKIAFIIYLASWLESTAHARTKQHLYQFIFLLAIIGGLIIMQPDMGTMSVIAAIAVIMYFVSGTEIKNIFYLLGGGATFFFLLIQLAPYRLQRLTAFLNPENDIRGVGYHIYQSLIAIGSGGIFGVGLGKSRQKFNYLPEAPSDSIFAVISEELGFIAAALLVVAFILLFFRGLKIARSTKDPFARLLVVGIISWFTMQAFMNMAALSSLIPLTGIPLPFVSYGGSALMLTLAAAGIVINISRNATRN